MNQDISHVHSRIVLLPLTQKNGIQLLKLLEFCFKNQLVYKYTSRFWHIGPKSLALAEGCWGASNPRRPLASFMEPPLPSGGLWPLPVSPMNFSAWVLGLCYSTGWNLPKNGWNSPNCMKFAWNCMKRCVKLRESITDKFLGSSTCFLIPNMLKLAQKWLK